MAKLNIKRVVKCLSENNCLPSTRIRELATELRVADADFEQHYNCYRINVLTTSDIISYILNDWKLKYGKDASIEKLSSGLSSIGCTYAADHVQELHCLTSSISSYGCTPNIFFDCLQSFLSRKFIGRKEELLKLECLFQSDRKLAVLSGLGGVGKSSIARNFAQTHREKYHCLLLRAETSSILEEDISRLGKTLGIETKIKQDNTLTFLFRKRRIPATKILEETLNSLRSKKTTPFLLVLDNVSRRNEIIDSVVSNMRGCEDVSICITTRLNLLFISPDIITIPVFELSSEDAYEMVENRLQCEKVSNVSELCKTLNNFPLGIVQAISYIHQRSMTSIDGETYNIPKFLSEFMLNRNLFLETLYDDEDKRTLSTVWDINFKQIKNGKDVNCRKVSKGAIKTLNVLAFLDPNGVEVEVLAKLSYHNFNKHLSVVKQSLELLKNYSLIRLNDGIVSIHRLVQEVTLLKQKNEPEVLRSLSSKVLCLFSSPANRKLLIHILCIWDHLVKAKDTLKHMTEIIQNICLLICRWMRRLDMFERLETFVDATIKIINIDNQNILDELKHSKALSKFMLNKVPNKTIDVNPVNRFSNVE